MKIEASSQVYGSSKKQEVSIDLRGDDPHASFARRSCRESSSETVCPSESGSRRIQTQRRTLSPGVIHDDTNSVLAHCISKLHSAAHGVAVDRDSLRERWELDDELKAQTVTNDLAELNGQFRNLEEVISQATKIIEERLVRR